jgi:hypothetical protein
MSRDPARCNVISTLDSNRAGGTVITRRRMLAVAGGLAALGAAAPAGAQEKLKVSTAPFHRVRADRLALECGRRSR